MIQEPGFENSREEEVLKNINEISNTDTIKARSWAFAMQTLFPNNYAIHFAAYKLEKDAGDHIWAAKNFSQIALHKQCDDTNFVHEIKEIAEALQAAYDEGTAVQNFYIKMLDYVSVEVLQNILLLTLKHTEDPLHKCKIILMMQHRFQQARLTHTPILLDIIAEGLKHSPIVYERLLLQEVIPHNYIKELNLPANALCGVFKEFLGCNMRKIIEESNKVDEEDIWKKIFHILNLTGELMGWEPFTPLLKNWDKFIEVIKIKSGTFDTSVLLYATTVFVYALHIYLKHCNVAGSDDNKLSYVLVEGCTESRTKLIPMPMSCETPTLITVTTPGSVQLKQAFIFAAESWRQLNREQYRWEFNRLLLSLPLAHYISRFLFDLAVYLGHREESQKLMAEMTVKSGVFHNMQQISVSLLQNNLTPASFECIVKIMHELPEQQGDYLEDLAVNSKRHMLFLPLTLRPIMQYCVKVILKALFTKIKDENVTDVTLGNILVLLQLEMPFEQSQATHVFELIANRRHFTYSKFSNYIVLVNFLEEFMHLHNSLMDFKLNIASATTMGSGSIRSIMKQQLSRSNENVTLVVGNFIKEEHAQLAQSLFSDEKHQRASSTSND